MLRISVTHIRNSVSLLPGEKKREKETPFPNERNPLKGSERTDNIELQTKEDGPDFYRKTLCSDKEEIMDYSITARQIIDLLGGEKNIKSLAHCMTRLRFGLADDSGIDDEKVKNVPGVLGVVRTGAQYQVIIGNNVQTCFAEINKLISVGENRSAEKEKEPFSLKNFGASLLDAVSGSIAPVIPVILGCGMVKILLILFDMIGISSELPTYQILTIIGDAGYYFLPLLIAYSASKKFNCHTTLSMAVVAVLLHPSLIDMISEQSTTFLRVPVTSASYSSTVIPALLTVWMISKLEPLADRIFKSWTRTLLKPMAILLVCVPIELIILAPLGTIIGQGMAVVLSTAYNVAPWLTIGVYSALLPLVVMCGMHVAVFPYIFSNLDSLGYDYLQLPAMLAYNLGQAGAALAVAVKTRNKDLKATATAAAVSAGMGGITEPALYGVTLRLRKPLFASMIASGITGVFIGAVGIKAFAFSGPCLLSFPMFISSEYASNMILACIAAVASVVITFVLTLVMGWEDPEEENGLEKEAGTENRMKSGNAENPLVDERNENSTAQEEFRVGSPLSGKVIDLSEVKDETFSSGVLGQGIAVEPSEGIVYAPFDGVVSTIFPTLHAIGLTDDTGMIDLLIHIGMDTVELNGEGYKAFCKAGDRIKKGDKLIEFDIELIKSRGYDTTTPVLVSNSQDFSEVLKLKLGEIAHDEPVFFVKK